jgi:hypothetical protein
LVLQTTGIPSYSQELVTGPASPIQWQIQSREQPRPDQGVFFTIWMNTLQKKLFPYLTINAHLFLHAGHPRPTASRRALSLTAQSDSPSMTTTFLYISYFLFFFFFHFLHAH